MTIHYYVSALKLWRCGPQCLGRLVSPGQWVAHGLVTSITAIAVKQEGLSLARQLIWHHLPISPVTFALVSDCFTG